MLKLLAKRVLPGFVTLCLCLSCAQQPAPLAAPGDQQQLEQARALLKEFGGELKAALQSAMAEQGPVHAITVCKNTAPQIAANLSRRSGLSISRSSLRVRNPANTPEPWQRKVMQGFEADGAAQEYYQAADTGTGQPARYMKAIPTAGLCLSCHGASIAPEVEQQLAQDYPHDSARGYQLNDIRGAFSVVWPLETP